ncbi:MAG TPA: urate hydroxylase PuuD [Burkholderiaceae bacterium]|nr:urate hydroxylase PuuD [Burkholderiaceae bacterium]
METYIVDWLNLGVRWLHFVAGIAWIGSSLYFVMLDNSLKAPKKEADKQRGVHGELWAVHGGGFYHSQKLLTGPKGEPLSQDLHWSKWEAYTTWLSGMGLLALIYWWGANSYLIDRSVLDISAPAAIAISAGSLVVGWLLYDTLCKAIKNEMALALIVFVLVVAAAYGYAHVFGARAAYIHTGALMGTIMVWNVFFHIIPGQKKMVEEIRAGKEPDPRPGIIGKQRSVHNTYFTLPVLFIMISNHYPMTYGNRYGWLILAVFILAGALIRQFFVLRHTGKVIWALPIVGALLLLGTAIALAPASKSGAATAEAVSFASVQPIFQQRCVTCHAEKPTFEGFQQPPAGVMLDTPDRIKAAAPRIHQQTIATQTMPLGNLTKMTPEERALLGKWLAEGANTK